MAALNASKQILCTVLLWAGIQSEAIGQKPSLDGMFGTHIFKPVVLGNPRIKSTATFNFWMGLKYRIPISTSNGLNMGFNYNIVSSRLSGLDSPVSTFLLMRYVSFPVTLDWKINKSSFSILTGCEPKIYTSVQQYTSEPYTGTKINFGAKNGIYNRYGLGFLAGIGYKKGALNYQLKYSVDVLPFRSYTTTRIFEQKLSFGFTFWPIL